MSTVPSKCSLIIEPFSDDRPSALVARNMLADSNSARANDDATDQPEQPLHAPNGTDHAPTCDDATIQAHSTSSGLQHRGSRQRGGH